MALFETFLLELAKALQFNTLAPDAQGACLIIMKEDNTHLLFELDDRLVPNTVLLSCPVGLFPMECRADVYEASLIGNVSIEETLSVKPDEDILYLHRRFHPETQCNEIEILLQDFRLSVKLWKEKLTQIAARPRKDHILPHPSSIQVFPYKA